MQEPLSGHWQAISSQKHIGFRARAVQHQPVPGSSHALPSRHGMAAPAGSWQQDMGMKLPLDQAQSKQMTSRMRDRLAPELTAVWWIQDQKRQAVACRPGKCG
ncbi:hypothetical protein J3458_014448 [Metarhizium acridum]|uniref:uncharacterized protein n=1 Tax=Metarhizium acridum TaxID=92637 RepID=UPI001C6C0816|nr:hypothetical protein J3458_014448 [Metarhizium acridum]